MTEPPEADDLVPVSVRLGTVVPPEDPEDWTRPLTWVAAIGMLAAPAVLLAWYAVASPTDTVRPSAGTYAVAIALVAGAAAAGATQIGRLRAVTGTLAAALLGALLIVMVGAVTAGEVGYCCDMKFDVALPTPNLAHAVAAALGGLAGSAPAAALAGLTASWTRVRRAAISAAAGALVTAAVLPRLFGA